MVAKISRRSGRPEAKSASRLPASERLLAAADELFYAQGVHVVGVDRIVERAGVAKASLYDAFGSKDELIRAYLEQHFRKRQARIARVLAAHSTARDRIVAIFADVEEGLAGSQFRGCRFISAAAEASPGDASDVMAREYRGWLQSLFVGLAKTAGATDPKRFGRQLALLYDGAAVAGRMDKDRAGAAAAVRGAVAALLDAAIPRDGD